MKGWKTHLRDVPDLLCRVELGVCEEYGPGAIDENLHALDLRSPPVQPTGWSDADRERRRISH